jgi:hypothetical protein
MLIWKNKTHIKKSAVPNLNFLKKFAKLLTPAFSKIFSPKFFLKFCILNSGNGMRNHYLKMKEHF